MSRRQRLERDIQDTEDGWIFPGAELTPDEVEFGLAMEAFKQETGIRFPTWSDALEVLRQLGYKRDARPDAQ